MDKERDKTIDDIVNVMKNREEKDRIRKEKKKEYDRDYYQRNKAKKQAQNRDYYQKRKGKK